MCFTEDDYGYELNVMDEDDSKKGSEKIRNKVNNRVC